MNKLLQLSIMTKPLSARLMSQLILHRKWIHELYGIFSFLSCYRKEKNYDAHIDCRLNWSEEGRCREQRMDESVSRLEWKFHLVKRVFWIIIVSRWSNEFFGDRNQQSKQRYRTLTTGKLLIKCAKMFSRSATANCFRNKSYFLRYLRVSLFCKKRMQMTWN